MRVTALYAALLTALYLFLTCRVIVARRKQLVDMGDGNDPLLHRLVRGHANFAEYAPLGLVLLGTLELGGWPPWLLHALGMMLLVGRVAHAWSFSVSELRLPSRTLGVVLTTTMLALAALLCLVQTFRLYVEGPLGSKLGGSCPVLTEPTSALPSALNVQAGWAWRAGPAELPCR
jgi:uncharacterized membrane protein YecN with MAPEG domain